MTPKNTVLAGVVVVLALYIAYQYDPTLFGLLGRREGFEGEMMGAMPSPPSASASASAPPTAPTAPAASASASASPASAANLMNTISSALSGPKKDGSGNAVGGFIGSTSNSKEGFADLASMEGPAAFASAEAPAGCYPRDQLTPVELLPADQNSIYAQQNPMGVGSLKGKNFLSAGALIGVNTVGQSLRNANLQLRSEPPNPQTPVSIFNQATIGPDISHRPLDVGP